MHGKSLGRETAEDGTRVVEAHRISPGTGTIEIRCAEKKADDHTEAG